MITLFATFWLSGVLQPNAFTAQMENMEQCQRRAESLMAHNTCEVEIRAVCIEQPVEIASLAEMVEP
jgi:hypothetical protein